ncbi:MAG: precorrin-3B synthase [Sulfitobacter sp.]
MTLAPQIKGWCPGALTPMMSGDGLVVRLRPPQSRLTPRQAKGIAELSMQHGSGILEVSNRANLQLRGVCENRYEMLIDGLRVLGLIDPNAQVENRRNILITPFYTRGDDTETLVDALTVALAQKTAPNVSAKFGYAVDTGAQPCLQGTPADVRLERASDGQLIVCAANHPFGKAVRADCAVQAMLDLARWSLPHGSRMSRILSADIPLPAGFDTACQANAAPSGPGPHPAGMLIAPAFGQIDAVLLTALSDSGPLRMTPWRMLLIECANVVPQFDGLITDPADPLLRVVACVGAPGCAQARGATRIHARNLASFVPAGAVLHVSGCAKGCALPRAADVTLTATPEGFDVIHNGTADAAPCARSIQSTDLPDLLKKAF